MHNPADRLAVCTIATKNYLARVRVLARSLQRFHPELPIYLLLADRIDGYFDPAKEPFQMIEPAQLAVNDLTGLSFQYTQPEFCAALKPFLLSWLFQQGYQKVLYFDPDIKCFADISLLFAALDKASFLLTPHLTTPLADDGLPTERDLMMLGDYNLGFFGIANTPVAGQMLEWWQQRMGKYAIQDHQWGYYLDQRWLDLVPGMFGEVQILRDPGYNVAYWNLGQRQLSCTDGKYLVNGEPLYFYHFSGLRLDNKDAISDRQDRYVLHDFPCLAELFDDYETELLAAGEVEVANWPYAFDSFANGVPIPPLVREIYRLMGRRREDFGDPFAVEAGGYYEWLNAPAIGTATTPPLLTSLAYEVYRRRADLHVRYPQVARRDRAAFAAWLAKHGEEDFCLPQPFLDSLQAVEVDETPPPPPVGRRGRVVGGLAQLGLGRLARKLLGPQLKNRLRDRLLWGRRAIAVPAETATQIQEDGRRPLGANVIGFIFTESGMGEKARGIIKCLEAVGMPVAGTSLDHFTTHRKRNQTCQHISYGNPYPVNLFCINADETPRIFDSLGAEFWANKVNIGYWSWELAVFPPQWQDRFAPYDEIWTPSNFCVSAIASATDKPVIRMPHAVEMTAPAPVPTSILDLPSDTFMFYFMFDYHSFAERKNPLGVLRAFQQAFPTEADVHLVLKGTDSRANPGYHNRLVSEINNGRVTVIDSYLDTPVIQGLLARCDCYVSLHRAEGFGLTMAEAMYLGKPVIATAYSANLDFMSPKNAYLVPYTMREIDRDYGPYKKGWQWADPDIAVAVQYMRQVYVDREAAAIIGAAGALTIHHEFSAAAVGAMVKARLEEIS
jgi:glycosyltransferase involved in cell wall biosynthesis